MLWWISIAAANDVVVATPAELASELSNAPTTGPPEDFQVWLLPGGYDMSTQTLLDKKLMLRAVVPGSVTLTPAASNRILNIRGTSEVILEGLVFDGKGTTSLVDVFGVQTSLTLDRVRMVDGQGDADTPGLLKFNGAHLRADDSSFADGQGADRGGLVSVHGGTAEFNNVSFDSGTAESSGGCLHTATAVDLRNVRMSDCSSESGGALAVGYNGSAVVEQSRFLDNEASVGAAIRSHGPLELRDSVICEATTTTANSSAVHFQPNTQARSLTVDRTAFVNNLGGGLTIVDGFDNLLQVTNSTFAGTQATTGPHATVNAEGGAFTLTGSLFTLYATGAGVLEGSLNEANSTFADNALYAAAGTTTSPDFLTFLPTAVAEPFAAPTNCTLASVLPSPLLAAGVHGSQLPALDGDGDGYASAEDCDDNDTSVHPFAVELCDGRDNNCDGVVDDLPVATFYLDLDGDGYGDANQPVQACGAEASDKLVANDADCDDDTPSTYPGAVEQCDGADNDCSGLPDHSPAFNDSDGDGYGDSDAEALAGWEVCSGPLSTNLALVPDDCDDQDVAVNPGVAETCNRIDDNCNGLEDDGLPLLGEFYPDLDGDGYGTGEPRGHCSELPLPGMTALGGDCEDLVDEEPNAVFIHPGAVEVCNGIDDDCNALIDDDATPVSWFDDDDGDGFGDPNSPSPLTCTPADGQVFNSDDCDDTDPAVSPAAVDDDCDGEDDDCDGTPDQDSPILDQQIDADGDGFATELGGEGIQCPDIVLPFGDCDDDNANAHPTAVEACGSVDLDCDGRTGDEQLTCTEVAQPPPPAPGVACTSTTAPSTPWLLSLLARR